MEVVPLHPYLADRRAETEEAECGMCGEGQEASESKCNQHEDHEGQRSCWKGQANVFREGVW